MTRSIVPIMAAMLASCSPMKREPMPDLSELSPECAQAVVVLPDQPAIRVKVSQWERGANGWQKLVERPGVIGRNGFAAAGEKREGDGKTPTGTFRIGTAFGYAATMLTRLDYRRATANDFWVDDPESPEYNRWVSGKPAKGSFEVLRRDDDAYELAAVIEYNTSPVVPGRGSAIFLHVWGGADHPTAGCVAVSKHDMHMLLSWLDGKKQPAIVLNPQVR